MKNQEHFLEKATGGEAQEYAPKKESAKEIPAAKPVMDIAERQEKLKRQIEAMSFPAETATHEIIHAIRKTAPQTEEKPGLWNLITRYFEERRHEQETRAAERFEEDAFSTLEYLLKEGKSKPIYMAKIEDVLQALSGEDSPKAEEMRERYKADMEYWEAITLSYAGVDTPSAKGWREKVIKMAEESKAYKMLAQATLVSLAGIDTDWAKDMRERGAKLCGDNTEWIGKSYRGIKNEEASAWRENLMKKYKEFLPQKQKLHFECHAYYAQGDKKGHEEVSKKIEKLYEKYPHICDAPELIAESLSGVQSEKTDDMLSWCLEEILRKDEKFDDKGFIAITSALTGRGDDFALKLQEQISGDCPGTFIIESLAGRDDKDAWEMRNRFYDLSRVPGGRTIYGASYDSSEMPYELAALARSLAGIKTKKAEEWRKSLLKRKHNAGGLGIHKVGVARYGIAQSFFGNPRTVVYKFLKKDNAETGPTLHLPEIKSTVPVKEQISAAESILGRENVRGPWSMGMGIDMEKLPPIPFTAEKLAQAKERGAYLKYQMPDDEKGVPITIAYLIERFGEKLRAKGYGDIVMNAERHKQYGESTFSEDSPRKGWFLAETRPVPFSAGKNEVEQTELMIDYLKKYIFEGEKLPEVYEKAAEEFEKRKKEILNLLGEPETRVEGCRMLEELHITGLLRPWPVELIMDQIADWTANKKYLHESMDILTGRQSSDTGRFVTVSGPDNLKLGSIIGIGIAGNAAQTIISRSR
jgi:hypothetical protein